MPEREGPSAAAIRSLSRLDAPGWHALPDYNDDVCEHLFACQDALNDGRAPLRAFATVYRQLAPLRTAHMCAPQRVRVGWLLAMAYAGVEDHLQALRELDDAVLAAVELDDADALADLLELRGGLNTSVQRFQEAREDYGDAADVHASQRQAVLAERRTGDPADEQTEERAADEARTLQQHAGTLYLLAQPQESAAALARARDLLLRHAPGDAGLPIAVAYTQAHLDRTFGSPEDALLPALHAASYFTEQGPSHANTAARTHVFSAEVALDMAERMETVEDRAAFLQMARAHLQEGARLAELAQRESGDAAVGLVRLTEQRLARLADEPASGTASGTASREQAIMLVLRDAEQREDLLLLAQAHTVLADDLAARGHTSEAIAHYERAIQVVERTEAPVLAIPARRALHRYGEQHPTPREPLEGFEI